MSALFDLHTSEQPEFATTPNLTAMPSTFGQQFSATMAEAGAPDHFYNIQKAQAERYGKIIDDIHTMTGERLANPATNDATMEEIRENWGQPYPMIFEKRLDKLRTKAREVRSSMPEGGYGTEPGYLDPDMVNTQIAAESRGIREAAAKLQGTGGFAGAAGAMAGGMVGSFENPFNILATFIPATRAPAWLAEQAVGVFLRNVGKEAVYQGVTQAGAQAVSSAVDYGTRQPLGTEQTAGEFAGEILGAAAGGFVIGGVARGAVPAWLTVRRMWGAGAYVPTVAKDGAIRLEGKAIYGDKNPLGLTASSNESALDKAMQDVALNRPADVSHLIETAAPQRPVSEAARVSHPDLMVQHDALTTAIDDIRARLNPTDETIAHLRGQVDEITARIQSAGPQTAEQAARLGGVAKAREIELQEALSRQAALARGEAVETPYTASLRQQLLTAQNDLRALSPQMKEALGPDIMARLAEEKALPPQAAQPGAGAQHRPDFDEWQKTNKLAGENGQPVMGYHGTTQTFERFDPARQGSGAGLGKGQSGFFFGGTPEMADEFAGKLGAGSAALGHPYASGGNIRPAYLRMENPKIIFDTGEGARTVNFGREIEAAKAEGHDGLVIRNTVEGGDVKGDAYVVFDAENIKNLDERYAVSPEMQRLQKMADEIEKAPPAQKPVAPAPEQPAGAAKPPGESPEDKAVLDQAKRMIESPEVAVPPEKRAAYNEALKQEQQAKVAAGCLAGAI